MMDMCLFNYRYYEYFISDLSLDSYAAHTKWFNETVVLWTRSGRYEVKINVTTIQFCKWSENICILPMLCEPFVQHIMFIVRDAQPSNQRYTFANVDWMECATKNV